MKPIASANFRSFSVEMSRDDIDLPTMSPTKVPDEKWKHVDQQGHGHFWKNNELPTLEWVVTGTQWVGDEHDAYEYDVGEYRCQQCGEVVDPGKRIEYPKPILGPMQITVTIGGEVFFLDEKQYEESLAAWAKALEEIRDRQ